MFLTETKDLTKSRLMLYSEVFAQYCLMLAICRFTKNPYCPRMSCRVESVLSLGHASICMLYADFPLSLNDEDS